MVAVLRRGSFASRRAGCLVVLVALAAGCTGESAVAPPVEPASFVDVTDRAGLTRVAQTYDATVADFDADGRPDLFVGNHAVQAALLRNRGDGSFADVTAASGIETAGDKHGTGWGDIDNDGLPDLYVSLGAGRGHATKQNRLYRNEGNGRFRDVTIEAGVEDPSGRARAVAWLDVDGDGWLDILVANYASPNRLYRNRGNGTFEDASDAWGISSRSATRITWADVDGDGFPDVLLGGTSGGIALLKNDHGRGFVDSTQEAGLAGAGGSVSGASFGDFDDDGTLDLYLAEGADFSDAVTEQPDGSITYAFFAGDEPVGFDFESAAGSIDLESWENGSRQRPELLHCGATTPDPASFPCPAGVATSPAMPDGDGLFLWRSPDGRSPCEGCPAVHTWHLRWRGPGDHHQTGIVRGGMRPTPVGFSHAVRTGGSLWRGVGSGKFERLEVESLTHDANSQTVAWADVNLDGTLDLYVVDSGVDGKAGTNVLFLNDGRGGFVRAPVASGAMPSGAPGRGVGAHFFDSDGDGRLDLFLTNGWGAPPFDQGPYRFLRNQGPQRHWLGVELSGTRSNRPGLGALIRIEACGRTQVRFHNGGGGLYSQSMVDPHFGLGDCATVSNIRVRWPSGVTQEMSDVPADQVVQITETTPSR